MDCEEELDIAIKQSANLTNWRLNFFPTLESPGVVAVLKTPRTERGAEKAGVLVVRKKNP